MLYSAAASAFVCFEPNQKVGNFRHHRAAIVDQSGTCKQSSAPVRRGHVSLPGSSVSRARPTHNRIDPEVAGSPSQQHATLAHTSLFSPSLGKDSDFCSVCRPCVRGIVAVKRLILQINLVYASLVGGSANAIAQFVHLPKTKRLVFDFPSTRVNSCFEENMAPERNHPCPPSSFEANYGKGNVLVTADEKGEDLMNLRQQRIGRPPRHHMGSSQLSSAVGLELDIGVVTVTPSSDELPPFIPVFRSGSCSDIGPKSYMEDEHICVDNLLKHLGAAAGFPCPGAFYGVFDGHGGTDAASFVRENILKFIVEDTHFPVCVKKAIKSAFLKADSAFANAGSFDSDSGTTVLTALICGRTMLIANAGDCRAVLGKRGNAIELSKDHKPDSTSEWLRIKKLGGKVCDGYLDGQLSVARAIGDWHMKDPEGSSRPLTAEPELQEMVLCEEDEFLILGCDGLWDVMSSQCAVTIVRKELMIHNDPERCSRELIREALKNTRDNVTVIVVCFSSDPPPQLERPKFKRSISVEGLHLVQHALDNNT